MNERPFAIIRDVTPGYFRTLRIPVVRGREFTEADDANPTPGFVVNEALAKNVLSDVDPLCALISVWMHQENPRLPIIGVAGNVSEGSVRDHAQPTVFYSHRQMPETGMTLFVRATRPTATAAPAVSALHNLDPNLAVTKVRRSTARLQRAARLSGSARWCPAHLR